MVERDKRKSADQDPAINAEMTAEVERLADELAEVREQLAATSEVLAAIGRSASDLEGVLETVIESARKLCGADAGQVFLVDRDRYRFTHGSGMTAEYREFVANNPVVLDRGTLVGRVALDRQATQITDVLADPDYLWTGCAADGRLPDHHGCPYAAGRRSCRGALGVANPGSTRSAIARWRSSRPSRRRRLSPFVPLISSGRWRAAPTNSIAR